MSQPKETQEAEIAAQAAGRGLISSVLLRNPIVALATVLLKPVLGLFRRRRGDQPANLREIKLERYSATRLDSKERSTGLENPPQGPMEVLWRSHGDGGLDVNRPQGGRARATREGKGGVRHG